MNIKQELRAKYKEIWSRDWPHDNATLQILWLEAKQLLGVPPKSKHNGARVKQECLVLMRLDHHF